ncbi:MAG TPA: hypothetical protein VFN60_07975 [Acidimicrobiales bacterium]|nr:hypothetical protein [Acidimicrobiales bacterium]
MMELGDALAWLDRHEGRAACDGHRSSSGSPSERMAALLDVLGHPEAAAPVIRVVGAHGKTATIGAIASLLTAKGLSVGTLTGPHLDRLNECLAVDGQAIADDELAEVLSDLADLDGLVPGPASSWRELLTAAALRWFSDRPVDVVVLEGGGLEDPAAAVDPAVLVVTDLEPWGSAAGGARDGAPVLALPGGVPVVLGDPDPDGGDALRRQLAPRPLWQTGRDYACTANHLAVGGRTLDIRTPGAAYRGVWLGLHGRHQGDNFATGLAATEAFFGVPVEEPLVREAAAAMRAPGQLEAVAHRPTVVVDRACDLAAARLVGEAVPEAFAAARSRILVVGLREGAEAEPLLAALGAGSTRLVVACAPDAPHVQPSASVVRAAGALGVDVLERDTVREALEAALGAAHPDDLVLVVGPPAVVAATRAALGAGPR